MIFAAFQTRRNRKSYQELEAENQRLKKQLAAYRSKLDEQKNGRNRIDQLNDFLHIGNETLGYGLGKVQQNLSNAVETAKGSLVEIEDIRKDFAGLSEKMATVSKDVDSLQKQSENTNRAIQSFLGDAQEINQVLDLIEKISNKINLIAFNAAVEATKVGAAGKGVAVVADEIKSLAQQSHRALGEIRKVVDKMTDSVEQVSQAGARISSLAQDAGQRIANFGREVDVVNDNLGQRFGVIHNTTDRVFLSLAMIDHILWNVNTVASVIRGEPAMKFVSHRECRLGKWYEQGEGRQYFSDSPAYLQLELPHGRVHMKTHEIFECLKSKDCDYERILKSFAELQQASFSVIDLLEQMDSRSKR